MTIPATPAAPPGAESITPELATYYGDRRLMWRNLGLILLLNVGWSVCFTVLGPLMQLRLNYLGVSVETLGLLSGVNGWVYSYAVMYFAWKSDHTVSRFGRRIPYLFLTSPIIILAVILFSFVHAIWLLILLALLQMFFTDIKAAVIPLLNIDCMPRRLLARAAAPGAIIMGLVNFMGLRFGMGLADHSETTPYILGAVIVAAVTLVAGFLIKEPPVPIPAKEKFRPWSAMKVAWKHPRTVLLMAAVALFQTFQMVYWGWIWLYAKNVLHMSRTDIGLTTSWSILVSVALSFPIGWMVDRVSPYKILPCYCLLAGTALWFLLHISRPFDLLITASLVAVYASMYGAADIMVYRQSHPSEIGSVTSTNSCLRGFYNGCLGMGGGIFIEKTGGHYDYAFIAAFLLTCLGLVPLFLFRDLTGRASKAVLAHESQVFPASKMSGLVLAQERTELTVAMGGLRS